MTKTSGSPAGGLLVSILLALGVVVWIVYSDTEDYPGPWISAPNTSIIQLITQGLIQDCDEFYYRQRRDSPNTFPDYLVRCTADRVTWNDYLVFPGTNAALHTEDYQNLHIPL